ncbi:hypothetical protein BSL78_08377 [Apostichopus japonicus]|uniref:DUF7041 domain-containing protein n=1 Tax=Stichopus japonicus TaxID=307972 RepID=A0A2G8L3A3_STIJA|nr:hypothetical protein BSL78_22748 [Apostichopus japonicus]PIK54731.1 hypothetical protein BSL78_08377 [Apostichopus japonicus]
MDNGNTTPRPEVPMASVSLKLPPFWSHDPALWFCQVEAQFTTRGIKTQQTKYAYVISSLQSEIAAEVRDLLLKPPEKDPYEVIKRELIRRTSESEQKRLHQLLTAEELGDRKPSQLLRRMRQLLGDRTLEVSILRQLFLQRLPVNAQLILASTSATVGLDQLAAIADKILEVNPNTSPISAIEPAPPHSAPTEIQQLRGLISELTAQVAALKTEVRQRSRSRGRVLRNTSTNRQHVGNATSDSPGMCWYHQKYGTAAQNCRAPCNFSSVANNSENAQANA